MEDEIMKLPVNQPKNYSWILKLLVFSSLVLLAFGIYQVVTNSGNEQEYTDNDSKEDQKKPSVHASFSDLLYTHSLMNEPKEEDLRVEQWMTDLSGWRERKVRSAGAFWIEPVEKQEDALELEPWMLNHEGWFQAKGSDLALEESESQIYLEYWMVSLSDWDVPIIAKNQLATLEQVDEQPLKLVSWMMNCCTWVPEKFEDIDIDEFSKSFIEDALALEDWMMDDASWLIIENNYRSEFPSA